MRGRRHAPAKKAGRGARRWVRFTVFGLITLIVVGTGGAYAAYRYEQAQADRLLPGVVVGGVEVGGMSRAEALEAVRAATEDELSREIEVRARGESWHVTPAELGTVADVESKLDEAFASMERLPWHQRVFHRFLDRPVEETVPVSYSRDGDMVDRFLRIVDKAIFVSPSDASIGLEDGEIVVERPKKGVKLDRGRARTALRKALRGDQARISLPVRKVEPKVTADELGQTIVVRIGEKKLYLYEGLRVVKTYGVATGAPGYPTPQGTWNIWDKRANPTWVNPAPDGWGANLPAVIGPGPGNPLGTHALYLDAPGIRIHGTYAESSIGTAASHGCIRMRIADSKELFSLVEVGTKVHVLP